MKIRYFLLIIITILIGGFISANIYITKEDNLYVDMADINDKYSNIKQKILDEYNVEIEKNNKRLYSHINTSHIEDQYNCQIFFVEESTYFEEVNNAIKENKVLIDLYNEDEVIGKIAFTGQRDKIAEIYTILQERLIVIFLMVFLVAGVILLWLYMCYIRPFKKLEGFAVHISKGDLDFPLSMTKNNYFGAFTEGFDIMREELKKAKQGEYEANISKKELVAELSHDIKTPVSTIKAICEILMIKVKEDTVLEKITVINQKAGVIDSLITDMFHSTLDDLLVLNMNPIEEFSTVIMPMFLEINHYGLITFENEIPECLIYADKLRLNQVIDNVINNSYKYANTPITVCFQNVDLYEKEDGKKQIGIKITIKDSGTGINEEELPLLSEKFYRGENSKGHVGSGLGLYLSKLFMEQMKGSFSYYIEDGFVVELLLMHI